MQWRESYGSDEKSGYAFIIVNRQVLFHYRLHIGVMAAMRVDGFRGQPVWYDKPGRRLRAQRGLNVRERVANGGPDRDVRNAQSASLSPGAGIAWRLSI